MLNLTDKDKNKNIFQAWFQAWKDKTLVFTTIGIILAIFCPDADDNWAGAFLGTSPLYLLACLCLAIRLFKIVFSEKKLSKCIISYDALCHKEILDAYFILMTYMTGIWIGLFLHMECTEWLIAGKTILLGYTLQIFIVILYNIGHVLNCIDKKFGGNGVVEKRLNIALHLIFIAVLIYFLFTKN